MQHTANVKWLTQTCRTAHRAGVPWALRIKVEKPWEIPPLAALKRLSYVCMRKLAEGVYDLISDGLSLDLLDGPGIAQQLRRRFTTLGETGLATFMLGRYEAANPGEEMMKWKTRAIEDEKAIGGLRNPHLSIRS